MNRSYLIHGITEQNLEDVSDMLNRNGIFFGYDKNSLPDIITFTYDGNVSAQELLKDLPHGTYLKEDGFTRLPPNEGITSDFVDYN